MTQFSSMGCLKTHPAFQKLTRKAARTFHSCVPDAQVFSDISTSGKTIMEINSAAYFNVRREGPALFVKAGFEEYFT